MELLPINVVSLVATIMAIGVVLVPVIGFTARFALQPVVDALGRYVENQSNKEAALIAERRMQLLEEEISAVRHAVERMADVQSFDAKLKSGAPPTDSPRARERSASDAIARLSPNRTLRTRLRNRTVPPVPLVPEQTPSREHHRDPVLVGGLNDLLVPDRTSWLDDGGHTGFCRGVDAVAKREEGV